MSNIRFKMPVNVTVQEPWSRVVRKESERSIITSCSHLDDVALDRVDKIEFVATGASDDRERMLKRGVKKNFMVLGICESYLHHANGMDAALSQQPCHQED